MKEKLALFDLDGTLFDTKDVNYNAYKDALSQFGYDIDYEYYCRYCNGRHYMDFLPKIIKNDLEVLNLIHEKKKTIYSNYLNYAIVNQHLFDIIRLIKSEYYTAVVTTASKKNCYEILTFFEVKNLFDLIITRDDVSNSKPDPEGYIKALEYFCIRKENAIIYEDTRIGEEAAKRAGIKCVTVRGYN